MARTRPAEVGDALASEFSAGSAGADVHVAGGADSGVLLAPTLAADFAGPDLPPGWFVDTLSENGSAAPTRDGLVLNGARVGTTELFQAGRAMEFEATFPARPHQHVGLGLDFAAVPWIMFSTKFGRSLYVRTRFHRPLETRLSGDWFGAPHRFRVDWNVLDVICSIDGEKVAHQMVPIVGFLRPLASNPRIGDEALTLHWLRLTPYRPKGTFVSRPLDAGVPVRWGAATWTADVPPRTSLSLQVRNTDTLQSRTRWSRWAALRPNVAVAATSRYLQYRARLATSDPNRTPVLRRVAFGYGPPED